MTAPAIVREADARRLARVAKAEGVAVRVKVGDREVTFFPADHSVEEKPKLDREREIRL